jgi:pSer/pThr/pTyr-binding forkhead associated (FHA) protein
LIYLGKCLQGNDRSSRERSCFCELSLENDKWVIRQVDSPYEIRINGHPVQAAELNSGDLIAIGKLRYRLQLVDGSPSNGSKTRQGGRSGGGVLSLFGLVRKKAEESSGPPVLGVLVPCRGGKATPLRKERTTVGRDKTCDVVIDDKTVSGLHCGLEYSQGHWKVVDLGSTNGILVNGVAYQSKWLVPGDELMISLHRFCIKYHPVGDLPEHDDVPCTAKSLSELAGIGDNLADRIASRHKSLEERTTERTDGSNDPLAAAEPTAADLE